MKLKGISKYTATPLKIAITVLMLLFILCFLQVIITQIGFMLTYKDTAPETSRPEEPNQRIDRSSKNFLPDGTIHLVYTPKYSRAGGKPYTQEQIYDCNDNLLWQGIRKDRPYEYLSWTEYSLDRFDDRRMKQIQTIGAEFSRMLEIPVNSESKTEQVWRYDSGLDLFAGYHIKGGIIGYIGSTGFTDSKSKAKPFGKFKHFTAWAPKDSFSPTLLWQTECRIYQIDFEKQQVRLLFESPKAKIKFVQMHNWKSLVADSRETSTIEYRPALHLQTEDGKHYLVMREPQQKLTITIPEDWRSDSVKFTATKQDVFLYYRGSDTKPRPEGLFWQSKAWRQWRRDYHSKPHKKWVELYRVADNGSLDLVNRFDWIRPVHPVTDMRDPQSLIKSYTTKVSPPVYDLAWYFWSDKLYRLIRYGSGMSPLYAGLIESFRPGYSILNWLLSAAMMGFAFWHGWSRRTCRGKLLFWLVLVGAFNLAGLLTYLALNHTAVIKCPACGKGRGLNRIDCVRCGAELPTPKRGELDLIFNA